MSLTTLLIILAVGAILAVVLLGRNSGPKVTQIDRTVRREEDDSDA